MNHQRGLSDSDDSMGLESIWEPGDMDLNDEDDMAVEDDEEEEEKGDVVDLKKQEELGAAGRRRVKSRFGRIFFKISFYIQCQW